MGTKSTFVTVRDGLEMPFEELYNLGEKAITFFEGTTLGTQLEADVKEAVAELKAVTEDDLKQAVTLVGVAALQGLSTGGTIGAIAAGIAAAPAAFKAAGHDISDKTASTLVTSVVNSLMAAAPTAINP